MHKDAPVQSNHSVVSWSSQTLIKLLDKMLLMMAVGIPPAGEQQGEVNKGMINDCSNAEYEWKQLQ